MRQSERPLRHRKARDRALIVPAVGTMLFLPPLAQIFEVDARIGGVPIVVISIFAVWALLILGAAILSRSLGEPELPANHAGDERGDPD
jgi:hypothetical protein